MKLIAKFSLIFCKNVKIIFHSIDHTSAENKHIKKNYLILKMTALMIYKSISSSDLL